MPMRDFKQIYDQINRENRNYAYCCNKCEENGGVIYCYKCDMETMSENYSPIAITLNMETQVKLLPLYYLEYDEKR